MGGATSSRAAGTALAAVVAAGAAAAVWGIGIERYLFTLRTHEVSVLPPGSRPLRVLHISDLHMAPWQRRKQDWVAALAELEPDLLVNTGDNLGHVEGLVGLHRAFDPLRGIPGLYVHGSNDLVAPSPRNPLAYFSGPSHKPRRARSLDTNALNTYFTDELGWHDLNNAATELTVGDVRIDAFGVSDAHREWDRLEVLPEALAGLEDGAELRIGVTHAPYRRVLDEFTRLGADALFAGHTHGGQVRIPFLRQALVANCDIPLSQARGLSTWSIADRDVPLNVSAGLGHSIYAPVRFACRPEASLITLLPRA